MQWVIERAKESHNNQNSLAKFMVTVVLLGIAGVSLPDLLYKHYTDITREGTNL